jgi:hypothetical protein
VACGTAVKIFVVANKIDLPGRQITPARGVAYADSIGCNHFEVSAKTGEGLDMLFRCLTEALVKTASSNAPQPIRKPKPKGQLLVVDAEEKKDNSSEGCCSEHALNRHRKDVLVLAMMKAEKRSSILRSTEKMSERWFLNAFPILFQRHPRTCAHSATVKKVWVNFGKPLSSKGSRFDRIIPHFTIQGGDFTHGNGRAHAHGLTTRMLCLGV